MTSRDEILILLYTVLNSMTKNSWRKSFHKTYVDFHFAVKAIVEDEVVCHADSVRLHGMTLPIVVVAHIAWKDRTRENQCLVLYNYR